MTDSIGGGGGGDSRRIISLPTTNLQNTEFISKRLRVPSGSTLEILEAGVQNSANNVPSGLTAEVDDETASSNVVSENSKRATGEPLGSVDGAADVAFRTENDTGAAQDATAYFVIEVA